MPTPRLDASGLVLLLAFIALSACSDPIGPSGRPPEPILPVFSITPPPSAVTIAGNFQSVLGCPGDWQPDCPLTYLAYDAGDDVWQAGFDLPAGSSEYEVALNDSWDENYGAHATESGANIPLLLPAQALVRFYYDDKTHWVTDNVNAVIATVPGSFLNELGCPGDWQADCLRSWLQDPDGDGITDATGPTVDGDLPGGGGADRLRMKIWVW
ncbi:MAG: hypothetical protein PVH00_01165 [Gemmatimonadota bacterium]|jgi:hypothetical protein